MSKEGLQPSPQLIGWRPSTGVKNRKQANISRKHKIMPTSITLQVDNPSILRSLKRILAAIEGVSIVNQKGSKSKTTVKMTEREFYAKIDHSIESAKDKECSTMLPQETGAEFIDRLLSK